VIDFWESAEAFDRFTQNKLVPVIQQLGDRGFPNPPERKDFPVYDLEQHRGLTPKPAGAADRLPRLAQVIIAATWSCSSTFRRVQPRS
jgi:hypothetical protein